MSEPKSRTGREERDHATEFVDASFDSENREQQQKLLETLQYSTVALRLAIACINSASSKVAGVETFKISDYLKLYEQMRGDLSHLSVEDDEPEMRTISLALRLSLDAIGKEKSGRDVIGICQLLAYLEPDKPIPMKLFNDLKPNNLTELTSVDAALKLLSLYGIGSIDARYCTFSIDRSLQEVIGRIFRASEMCALDRGLELFTRNGLDPSVVDHAISLWDHASNYGVLVEKYHSFIEKILLVLNRLISDNGQTVEFGKRQLEVMEKHLGQNHVELLRLKNELAIMVTNCVGERSEIKKLARQSTEIVVKNNPCLKNHLTAQFNTAIKLSSEGKQRKALKILQALHEECKEVKDIESSFILLTRGYIARLEYELDSNRDYIRNLKEIVEELDDTSESADQAIRSFKREAANVLMCEGEYDVALKIFKKSPSLLGQILDPYDLPTTQSYKRMGHELAKRGDFLESIKILADAEARQVVNLGRWHPETRETHTELLHIKRQSRSSGSFVAWSESSARATYNQMRQHSLAHLSLDSFKNK